MLKTPNKPLTSGADEMSGRALLDALIAHLHLKNDAALGRLLEVPAPVISKVRHKGLRVSPGFLLRVHEVTGLPVPELRKLARE